MPPSHIPVQEQRESEDPKEADLIGVIMEDLDSAERAEEKEDVIFALAGALKNFTLAQKLYPLSASLPVQKTRLDALSRNVKRRDCSNMMNELLEALERKAGTARKIPQNFHAIQNLLLNVCEWMKEYAQNSPLISHYEPLFRVMEATNVYHEAIHALIWEERDSERQPDRETLQRIADRLGHSQELLGSATALSWKQKKLLKKLPWIEVLSQRIERARRRVAFLLKENESARETSGDDEPSDGLPKG